MLDNPGLLLRKKKKVSLTFGPSAFKNVCCEQPASPAEIEGTRFQAKLAPIVGCGSWKPAVYIYSPKSKAQGGRVTWVTGPHEPAPSRTLKRLLALRASDFVEAIEWCLHPSGYVWVGWMDAGGIQGGLRLWGFSPWDLLWSWKGSSESTHLITTGKNQSLKSWVRIIYVNLCSPRNLAVNSNNLNVICVLKINPISWSHHAHDDSRQAFCDLLLGLSLDSTSVPRTVLGMWGSSHFSCLVVQVVDSLRVLAQAECIWLKELTLSTSCGLRWTAPLGEEGSLVPNRV